MEGKKRQIEAWTLKNKPIGEALGYPECCIHEFCQQPPELMRKTKPAKSDRIRYQASLIHGEFSGFIPCLKHAKEILKGKITLAEIVNEEKRQNGEFFIRPFPFQ